MTPRRASRVGASVAAGFLVATLAIGPTSPVESQQTVSEARAEREELRQERAAAAAELDAAEAADAEVAAALRDVTDLVNAQQARVDEATRQLEANRAQEAAAIEAMAAADAESSALTLQIGDIAVTGFVNQGQTGGAATFFGSADINQALRQNSLLDQANVDTVELLEQLRIVQEDREIAEVQAADAVAEAARLEAELSTVLVEYEAQLAVQAELKAEMERRVADWESTVATLEAEDDALETFIKAEEARLAAAAAAAAVPSTVNPTASNPQPSNPSVSGFQWPVNGRVSSPYGYRVHPIYGTRRLHAGLDISGGSGTPIAAASGGQVILAGWNGGYGNCVIISHGNGVTSLYAHQSKIGVSVGQQVSRGDVVGYVGSTGQSTGPHLHFEIRINGSATDPRPYLP